MSEARSNPSIVLLEQQLAAAQDRERSASAALAPKHKSGEWEAYRSASVALLMAERALAAAKGEEHAEPADFPVRWSTGAPLPHLIANDYRTLLVFLVDEPDPKWDGT